MKALLVSSPMMGHLHPVLGVGRILIADGWNVMGLTSSYLRDRVEKIGAQFRSFVPAADVDTRDAAKLFPEIMTAAPGAQQLRLILEQGFANFMLAQYESIKIVMQEFPPDIIIGDHLMLGVLPMLLGPRAQRPSVALLGTTYLLSRRDDGAPNDAGIRPARNDQQLREYASLFQTYEQSVFGPAGRCVNEYLAQIGSRPLRLNLYDAMVELPDIYLQLTVPRFELPRRRLPSSVHFVGPLPITPNQAPVPSWAYELDGSRKVVLVTQGTLTNNDFSELTLPTLEALANERDVLVMVTTGGRPIDALGGPLPGNVRVAQYLPFEWALSKADAFVTNGGYGSVNQALSYGVPIVAAGTAADRGDVSIRVAWSGVGVNLATNAPTAEQLRPAVRSVLDDPRYRQRAASLAEDIREIDTPSEIRWLLRQQISLHSQDGLRPKAGAAKA
ncbi:MULTISPECIES: nucleotide disphospho-sugar-binding domain-containing protein [unclassified Bradyrhizobium]